MSLQQNQEETLNDLYFVASLDSLGIIEGSHKEKVSINLINQFFLGVNVFNHFLYSVAIYYPLKLLCQICDLMWHQDLEGSQTSRQQANEERRWQC